MATPSRLWSVVDQACIVLPTERLPRGIGLYKTVFGQELPMAFWFGRTTTLALLDRVSIIKTSKMPALKPCFARLQLVVFLALVLGCVVPKVLPLDDLKVDERECIESLIIDNNNDDTNYLDTAINECIDQIGQEECQRLAHKDGCIKSFLTMRHDCAATCEVCRQHHDFANHTNEEEIQIAFTGLFNNNERGAQLVPSDRRLEAYRHFQKIEEYMYETVYVKDEYENVRVNCQNRYGNCTIWALDGKCDIKPGFMKLHCAPSCFSCHEMEYEKRCPFDDADKAATAVGPDDLNLMFERILTSPDMAKYSPTVIRRPNPPVDSKAKEGPWMVLLDDFLSEEECDELIRLGHVPGYQKSTMLGDRKADGSYEVLELKTRTSSNAWCEFEECQRNPASLRVHKRLELLTGTPRVNFEFLQLLRYEPGQFYKEHLDYIPGQRDQPCGGRVSSNCEDGRVAFWWLFGSEDCLPLF